jgi:hypothetical protein
MSNRFDPPRQQLNDQNEAASSQIGEIRIMEDSTALPVGVSRLHEVSLPVLQMKPIYWSPVNDISIVMRATWFYK